jgi:hypothetical protein
VRVGIAGARIPEEAKDYRFSKTPGALFRGIKWLELEIFLFLSSTEVKNE